jgi:hypothetical protein
MFPMTRSKPRSTRFFSPLWNRRLERLDAGSRAAYRATLLTRSRYIWANSTAVSRRGYFLAGLGLEAGHALDAVAPVANDLLVQANAALLVGDHEAAITAITGIAERVFSFYPFEPDPFPDNWRDILRCWLLGQPLASTVAGQEGDALQFIEGGLVYRLPWAMEALRVRAAANGDVVGVFGLALADHELGLAVPAVETGTMNRSTSISSRRASTRVWQPSRPSWTPARLSRRVRNCGHGCARLSSRPGRLSRTGLLETRAMWLEFVQEAAPAANGPGHDGTMWGMSSGSRRRLRPALP